MKDIDLSKHLRKEMDRFEMESFNLDMLLKRICLNSVSIIFHFF